MISSCVGIILNSGYVLLLKRHSYDDTLPNKFCLPGGKLEPNESLTDCLNREVLEETNLTVNDSSFLVTMFTEQFTINFYIIDSYSGSVEISDEHEFFIWCKKDDLCDHDLPEQTKIVLNSITF